MFPAICTNGAVSNATVPELASFLKYFIQDWKIGGLQLSPLPDRGEKQNPMFWAAAIITTGMKPILYGGWKTGPQYFIEDSLPRNSIFRESTGPMAEAAATTTKPVELIRAPWGQQQGRPARA